MKISLIAFTEAGAQLCARLLEELPQRSEGFATARFAGGQVQPLSESLREWTRSRFLTGDALIFICAAGIAVRSIAPFIRDKQSDPAVVSVDEQGRFAVPLLSGHIGGANALARRIAEITGGVAAISTATDVNGLWSPDAWAIENDYHIDNVSAVKIISAALLEGKKVGFQSDFPVDGNLPPNVRPGTEVDCGVVISLYRLKPYSVTLNFIPKCLTVGVGCRKGISSERLEDKILRLLIENGLPPEAMFGLATIDLKSEERAIIAFCEKYKLPLFVYSVQELESAKGEFSESRFVMDTVGVGTVCERAAALSGGALLVPKTTGDGVALAISKRDWRVRF